MNRRHFTKQAALATGLFALSPLTHLNAQTASSSLNTKIQPIPKLEPFKISLSQWAFESEIFGKGRENYRWFKQMLEQEPEAVLQGPMHTTDIVIKAQELGVHGVDLVTSMIYAHRDNPAWLRAFKQKANDHEVEFICLMADTATKIGASNTLAKARSIDDHKRWIEAALELGCHHVRINPFGDGTYLEQMKRCAESLYILSEFASNLGMQLTVENHGHPSSNAAWLNMLIEMTNHTNLGVFLDFGNFFMGGFNAKPRRWYDLKQGILDLSQMTVGVSAKTRQFLANGDEATIDYNWNMEHLKQQGFNGWVSAEYAGKAYSNTQGAQLTIAKLRQLQKSYIR